MELPTVPELARMIDHAALKHSGVRTSTDDALAMIGAGATRLGTSSTAETLAELRRRRGEV